jgi:eukaryotic-like serine/threonine-protein kinase
MRQAILCPQCRKTVPADAPQGLCPVCVMQLGLDSDASEPGTLPPQPPSRAGEETVAPPLAEFVTKPMATASDGAPVNIPGYEILGELGRGGMGVVYKARQIKLNRIVALKMILAGSHAGSAELTRFRTEAEAIARVKHVNIIQIYEIGDHEGKPYFALEFCSGGSLAQQTNGTPVKPKEAARIVEKLARGMEAAHQEDIIHRDLKPANVLFLKNGTPKITDFGLAKKLDDVGQTQSGAIMGTPSYMAPEQAGGETKKMGPPADIYALGAILYELLTGRPPFKAATPLDTIMQVVTDEPMPPSALQKKTPRDLETICLKCLEKDPAKRYASAQALAEDLRRYQKGEPIHARPVGSIERTVKWVKRHPLTTGLITVILLVAVVGFVGISGGLGWALVERENAIGQEKKTADALRETKKAQKKAEDEKTIAEKARQEAEAATKEMKKQLLRAETLVVRVKFEHAFHQPEENRALSMLSTAALLREPVVLENQPLRDSLGLHLANWFQEVHPLKWVCSHNGGVAAVAFCPDGKTVLTGSYDHTARLWETATGKPVGPPLQHQGPVVTVAFSNDGKTVLTGSDDNTARLWETATGKPLGPPLQHQGWVRAVAFSNDGKTVLTGSRDKTARLWEVATGKPLGPPLQHQNIIRAVAFSPDGKTVLTGSDDTTARLWETATGKPFGPPLQHRNFVVAVAFSPGGKTVLTGSSDKTARLWETATGKPLGSLQHQAGVSAVAFSLDGKTVVTGCGDKTARLWETATGKPLGSPLQHQAWVSAVAFSLDGKTVLTGSQDGTARLWETATGKPLGPPLLHQEFVSAVAFSPDGNTVLTGSSNTARLWETAAGKLLPPPLQHQEIINSVAFSPDSKTVLTGSCDKTARLWETATGKPLGPPLQHQGPVVAVAFSKDGKTVLTGSRDNTARLWETATGKPLGPPLQHRNSVVAVAFSTDGKLVLTGSYDKTARLWETATSKPVGPPLQHRNSVVAVAFSPDGKTVLTGSHDETARLWETATGKPLGPHLQHQGEVHSAAFSQDGKTVLTGSQDGTARLWETTTSKPLGPSLQHQDAVWAVAFSPDGKTVLTGSNDSTARLWRAPRSIEGDPERILLWTQLLTGAELDEYGQARALDANTWQQRRQQLENLGGQPQ